MQQTLLDHPRGWSTPQDAKAYRPPVEQMSALLMGRIAGVMLVAKAAASLGSCLSQAEAASTPDAAPTCCCCWRPTTDTVAGSN